MSPRANFGAAPDPAPLPVEGVGAMTPAELAGIRKRVEAVSMWDHDAVRLLATVDALYLENAYVREERDTAMLEIQRRDRGRS